MADSGFRALAFGVEPASDRGQFFDGLLMRLELFAGCTGLVGECLNVFSFLFLPHERDQHLICKLVDHP